MKIQLLKLEQLKPQQSARLWEIYQRSYTVSREEFLEKQRRMDRVALYFNASREIVGFTGLRDRRHHTSHGPYRAIYFGQTVILPEYRGRRLIQKTVIRLILPHFIRPGAPKLYIWNDSLSYRPYLVLARGLRDYYPSRSNADHPEFKAIRDSLGMTYYPEMYCPKTGTVRKAHSILKNNEATLSDQDWADPDIQYFVERNPLYREGHGLITFCPATLSNLFYYIFQVRLKGLFRKHAAQNILARKTSDTPSAEVQPQSRGA